MKTQTPDYFYDNLIDQSVIIPLGEGEQMQMNGMTLTFKITSELTNDQLGLYEIVLSPRTIGAKLHYHRFMDETFIVTEGTLTLQVGNAEYQAAPGTVAYLPRFTPHGFRNDTDGTVRITLLFNPAQKREGFFRGLYETLSESPIDPKKYLMLYNKYDSFPVNEANMLPIRED